MPDPRFLKTRGPKAAGVVNLLDKPDVTHDAYVPAKEANVHAREGVGMFTQMATGVEVELVKPKALDQLPARFRLEARKAGIAQLSVRSPFSIPNSIQKAMREVTELRFCRVHGLQFRSRR